MKEQHLEAAAPGSSSKVVYETCSGLVGGGGDGYLFMMSLPYVGEMYLLDFLKCYQKLMREPGRIQETRFKEYLQNKVAHSQGKSLC